MVKKLLTEISEAEYHPEEEEGEGVKFADGAYFNFPQSQKIRDGITMVKAKGYTNGNSLVIIEKDGLFCMIHGDITYVDEALYREQAVCRLR